MRPICHYLEKTYYLASQHKLEAASTMRRSQQLLLTAIAPFLLACQPSQQAPDLDQVDIDAARASAAAFGKALQAELVGAIQEGGPVAAVNVCNEKAPEVANKVSEDRGLEIGRTALKVRNPNNVPDVWEATHLRAFEQQLADGVDLSAVEVSEVVKTENGYAVRWMKPIMMGDVCTVCHGSTIDPELDKVILSLYPEDQARGMKAGELRGAFTATKYLQDH